MLLYLFLVCATVFLSVVAANPLLQALPLPACPICPQNAVKNQPPNLPWMIPQPACNNQPCCPTQTILNTLQNQLKPPCQPQVTQTSANQLNQVLYNTVMSNPTLRSILDPNTRIFNQNGVEVQRNTPCNNGIPNVVNNYIIVPPEFLLEDSKCNTKEDKKIPAERRGSRNNQGNGRRTQKPKVVADTISERVGNRRRVKERDNIIQDKQGENGTVERQRKRRRRPSKNANREVKVKVQNEYENTTEVTQIGILKDEELQKIDQNDKQNDSKVAQQANALEGTTTTPFIDNVGTVDENSTNSNALNNNSKSVQETEHNNNVQKETIEANNIIVNDTETHAEKPKRKKKQRSKAKRKPPVNTREEAAIHEFHQKFPNIPEDLLRKLLDHMKRQLQKEELRIPAYYHPQFPINYDQLYGTQYPVINYSNRNQNSSNKRQNNRRKKQKNSRNKNNATDLLKAVELTPLEDTNIEDTTTEKVATDKDVTITPIKVAIAAEIVTEANAIETTTLEIEENVQEFPKTINSEDASFDKETEAPELGSEDVVPIIYANGVDEYYPDFTGDSQFYSDEDFSFITLEDDKYHYTTDKNYAMEELNRERRKFESNFNNDFKRPQSFVFRFNNNRNVRPRNKADVSKSRLVDNNERPRLRLKVKNDSNNKPHKEEPKLKNEEFPKATTDEIQFRTPPTLEKVDFETKQVNKDFYFHDLEHYTDKTSTFSDVKTPQYIREKDGKSKERQKDVIETVFAKSKVVNYGKLASEELAIENDNWTHEIVNDDESDDDKTIVLAKTITDDYW